MDEQENSSPFGDLEAEQLEGVRIALRFIADRVMSRPKGDPRKLTAKFIATRMVVIWKLLDEDAPSLRAYARDLGVSPASLSQLATLFGDSLGMRASWQRIELREKYRRRALGVHAGTWHCTDETELKKLRKAQKAKRTLGDGVSPLKVTETAA